MKIRLDDVRLAFPNLFEAKTVNGEGKPAYSASFLFAKDSPNRAKVVDALKAVAQEKWGAKGADVLKSLVAADKVCLHNGDSKADYAGFAGMDFVSARNAVRPKVIDGQKNPLTEADGKIYGGCYVNVVLELWAQENAYGKRINATLMGVQFARDGDAFAGGRSADDDDFDVVEQGAGADDFM